MCILQRQLMVCARLYALTYLCSDQGGADCETQCDVFVLFFSGCVLAVHHSCIKLSE